ncbi:unnamed protein product [Penicillium roqueforti FM164]|uniref:Str. FM013 n=2 Tax=Penicillium TaxID=5073 RepID=A0A0G4PWH8_PENC3|nr:unnamed protein product [Penicillium roqueforti FM164]CRL30760.1 unnamed protein product [Penicillium camemberti]
MQYPGPLEIPGPRDEISKEYSECQVSNVIDDTLKAAFQDICDMMIDNGPELEQVYKDQDQELFIGRSIKILYFQKSVSLSTLFHHFSLTPRCAGLYLRDYWNIDIQICMNTICYDRVFHSSFL